MKSSLLALLMACGPTPIAQGILLPPDAEAWRQDIEKLIGLQAMVWQDPGWPDYIRSHLTVSVEFRPGPFNCGYVWAAGCTQNFGGIQTRNGQLSDFTVTLIQEPDVFRTAIGYELGHVYAQTHGIPDDDTYRGEFWDRARQAIDSWSPKNTQ